MSHYDSIHSISSYNETEIPSCSDLGALGELFPATTQLQTADQTVVLGGTNTADQLISLAQSPLPLSNFGSGNFTTSSNQSAISATSGMLAGMGALLAPGECEPGDLSQVQIARSVIHRDGDSKEAAFESLLSPPEVNLADLWLKSGQNDWMNLDQLPNGHPRKISRFKALRSPSITNKKADLDPERKEHVSGNIKTGALLHLLSKLLKSKPKNYVTGLRGELLEEGDEQLLGNTDTMILPYSPALPFVFDEATKSGKLKRERDEKERAKWRKWRDRNGRNNHAPNDGEQDRDEGEELPEVTNYMNFDIFDFFEKLLTKSAAE